MKYKLKMKFKIILVCILSLTLISTGSLAWRDTTQHKTNKLDTVPMSQNVVLIEKFEPVKDWKVDQSVTKQVYVKNGQNTDDTSTYAFTDAYVRVQIREFLGISKNTVTKTDFRLLTDEKGNFIKFDTKHKAEKKAEDLKLSNAKDRVVEIKGYEDDKKYFYVKVNIEDQLKNNGQYLVTDVKSSGLESLETHTIIDGMDDNIKENHNSFNTAGVNIEDTSIFSTHTWEHGKDNLTPDSNIFKEYISWEMGEDVISIETWKTDFEMKPVKKWIVDTSLTGEGWVYWGMPLKHSIKDTEDSKTSDLIKKIKLLKEGEGTLDYRMHINLDAVSKQSLSYWGNAPQEILNMFNK